MQSVMNRQAGRMSLVLRGVLAWTVFSMAGCGYGKVGDQAYGYARALYTVCNLKNPERLAKLESQLQQASVGEGLSEKEKRWLMDIVSLAKRERWDAAARSARRMVSDQVERK